LNRAWHDACVADLAARAFGLGGGPSGPPRIGAEVELIPVDAVSRRIAPIDSPGVPSTRPALRAMACRVGWTERRSTKSGQMEFHTASGGRITFEPGGQVEYASPPLPSVTELLADIREHTAVIREALSRAGLDGVFAGIDPVNEIDDVPLQMDAPRYRRMDGHFASIGPYGARMMRQTASIQISVDVGDDPLQRWRLLNGMAPFLAAMFANAPVYGGRQTDEASIRRQAWGRLDPGRTGLPCDEAAPVEAYADFAMRAASILGPVDRPPFPPFAALPPVVAAANGWERHLSTLFPEIRPRGYFEIRSIDALDPAWYAAPLVMVAGLALDAETAAEAGDLVGRPDPALLEPAGRVALAEPRLGRIAGDLARLAVSGAESLGARLVGRADLDEATAFFDRFTWAGRAPADVSPVAVA